MEKGSGQGWGGGVSNEYLNNFKLVEFNAQHMQAKAALYSRRPVTMLARTL